MARERITPSSGGEEGAPAWMNTYGDMVTLLLTFFVLLFAFSTISETKWKDLVASFQGNPYSTSIVQQPGDPSKPDINMMPKPKQKTKDETLSPEEQREDQFQQIIENVQQVLEMNNMNNTEFSLEIRREGDFIIMNFNKNVLFKSGSSDLRTESLPILTYVREMLIEYMETIKMIRIEGHTDNVPIRTARFRDNWELSTSRAVSVLEFMLGDRDEAGVSRIDTKRISAAGYGEYHPVAENNTEDGKQLNRRVEIILEKMPAEDTSAAVGAPAQTAETIDVP